MKKFINSTSFYLFHTYFGATFISLTSKGTVGHLSNYQSALLIGNLVLYTLFFVISAFIAFSIRALDKNYSYKNLPYNLTQRL